MKRSQKANIALLATVVFWSFHVIIARATVATVAPLTLQFLRMLTALVFFFPFLIINKPWRKKEFGELAVVSLLATVNFVSFMWGIQFTTASASQLIYAFMPVLIVLLNIFILKKAFSLHKILGVLLGFFGIMFIVYLSKVGKGTTISGGLVGNLVIAIGMFSWVFYIFASKRLSKFFSPIEIGSMAILVSFLASAPLFVLERVWLRTALVLNAKEILGILFMGFAGTFATHILYQYAIRYSSPLKVSLASYIQPITTAILAMIFLGEIATSNFAIGSLMVFLGIFLTTTVELYHQRK